MTGRADELIVGALCLLVVLPWLVWTLRRGLARQRLPIGKGYVERAERPGAFRVLLGLYIVAGFGIAFVGVDLLFGLTA